MASGRAAPTAAASSPERKDGVRAGRADRGGQLAARRIVTVDARQAELLGGLADAGEPECFAGAVAVGDDERHVDAAGMQHPQAAVADIRVGEDDRSHAVTSLRTWDDSRTALIR